MRPIRYITSLLTFYLKGEISLEKNFVMLKKPNTILSLIPLGAKKESVPVSQLASVESNFELHFGSLLVGVVIGIIGASLLSVGEALWGLILLLVGLNKAVTAFETVLTLKTTAGDEKDVAFLVFEKGKAEEAEREIRLLVSNRLDDTNGRELTAQIVDAINRK